MPAKSSPVKVQSEKNQPTQTRSSAPAVLDVAEVRAALQKSAPSAKKTRTAKSELAPETIEASAVEAAIVPPKKRASAAKISEQNAVESAEKVPPKKRASVDQTLDMFVESVPDANVTEQNAVVPEAKSSSKKRASAANIGDEGAVESAKVVENKAKPTAKRSRVPKDLAAQYGGAPEAADVPRHVVEASAPRKRLTRAKKEARSQLLRADDAVLQRLQQANAVEVRKPATRGRGWEFVCGCCGRITRFGTPAAICECGAIAVRE